MSSPVRIDRSAKSPQRIAFDNFEADLRSGELRKAGYRIRLQAQPFQLLALLLRNAGEVVTRDEIFKELWPGDTFVDFEHGLAAAVNKVRDALSDSADEPRYIETLPKRGYRFIGKIEPEAPAVMAAAEVQESARLEAVPEAAREWVHAAATGQATTEKRSWNWRVVAAVVALLIVAGTAGRFMWAGAETGG